MKKLRALLSRLDGRLRHALIALAITLVLTLSMVLEPLDRLGWIAQARLAERPASGDIVFVGVREDVTNPAFPERRVQLANALREMNRSGADRVFLDIVIDKPSTEEADRQLAEAIRSFGNNIALTRRYVTDIGGASASRRSLNKLASETAAVAGDRRIDVFGYTWEMRYAFDGLPTLPAKIAGIESTSGDEFPIDYGYSLGSIPVANLGDFTANGRPLQVAGKTIVVGEAWESSSQKAKVPGHFNVPASLVSIYAAETLLADSTFHFTPGMALTASFLALILTILIGRSAKVRRMGYAILFVTILTASIVFAYLGVRASLTSGIVLLAIYGALRSRLTWQRKFALTDEMTGLPNFRALERAVSGSSISAPIVVAKIHGFQDAVKTLRQDQHAEYILRLVDRLKLTQEGLPIYANEGRYLAWQAQNHGPASLGAHLEGLRALFSQPIKLEQTEVDVGITFGVDLSEGKGAPARVASALAAVESTSEANAPIRFEEIGTDSDDLWNISLQARIDAALDKNEIFLVYQPKVCTRTGAMIGVESLVRWNDPERGLIPPGSFIGQCEKAGRMDHLTRHVLSCALGDAQFFADHGLDIVVSVNISATLLRDDRVETMVREMLAGYAVAPERLCLEITETSQIADIDNARSVLTTLSGLGIAISIDDFGVGAANVETLFHLPFSEIKIDQLFTRNILTEKGRAIMKSLILLGNEARLEVVAEGVEDAAILRELIQLECPAVQGFVISHPVSREEIVEFQPTASAKVNGYS